MQFSHLLLRNFGKFEEFSCDFTPGLNLIKGPNEAGKSTLASAITAALFLDPVEGGKKLADWAHWENNSLPALEAILDAEGGHYKLLKDFGAGKIELENQTIGIKNKAPEFVEEWLAEQIGIPSEEIFRATACIAQGEITHIESSFEAIKDKLESLVTGGKEERAASIVLDKINKRIAQISGDDDDSGVLDNLDNLAKEIDYNIDKLSREIATLKSRRADLIQVEMTYRNVGEDLGLQKERLERSLQAGQLEESSLETSREYHDLENKISEAHDSLKKIKALRDHQASLKPIESEDIIQIEKIESSLGYLKPKQHELDTDTAEAVNEYRSYKVGQFYVVGATVGAIGILTLTLSYFLEFLSFLTQYSTYGFFGSIPLLVFSLGIAVSRNQHRKYLSDRTSKLKSKLESINEEFQNQTITLNRLLGKYSAKSLDELRHNFWQYDDLEKQVVHERQNYDGVLGGKSFQELETRKEALEETRAKIIKDKKDLSQDVLEKAEQARLTQIVNQYEERIKDLERERTTLRQQIEAAEGGAELLAGYIERREQLDAKAIALKREVEMLQLTADCINEARQNVLVSTLDVLNTKTSDILNKLTSGRYSRVRFDKVTMKFEIYSDDKGKWLDPETGLSVGTIDQIYLAARLALAELIAENKSSVMILDDPFAGYDQKRMENAMKVVKELSENHQILLLTSHDHYDKWADSMIALS